MHTLTDNIEMVRLREENKNLKELVDKLRIFKHDYCNVIASISGYIALNDMNGLKRFVGSVEKEICQINQLQAINTKVINEPCIFSLISAKYRLATSKGISFCFFSDIDYQKLGMDIYEFSKIMGILLDNAIDAASISKEKEIQMRAELTQNNAKKIVIKNTYSNKDVDITKIFLKGYSSKKVKSGLGLWEVKEILNRYSFIDIFTKTERKLFYTNTNYWEKQNLMNLFSKQNYITKTKWDYIIDIRCTS